MRASYNAQARQKFKTMVTWGLMAWLNDLGAVSEGWAGSSQLCRGVERVNVLPGSTFTKQFAKHCLLFRLTKQSRLGAPALSLNGVNS